MAAADSDELAAVCAGRGLFSRRRQPVSFKWRWSPGRIDSLCGVSQAGYHGPAKSCRLEGRQVTRREVGVIAIAASATSWRHASAQAQATSAAAALCPTGKLRAALIASNPVLVTRRPDGTLGGVSVVVARTLAAHLGVPIELKPYDNPARYNESLAPD